MTTAQLKQAAEIIAPGVRDEEDEITGFECMEISDDEQAAWKYPSGTVKLEIGYVDDEDREKEAVFRTNWIFISPAGEVLTAYEV